jgi:hypothetical protein
MLLRIAGSPLFSGYIRAGVVAAGGPRYLECRCTDPERFPKRDAAVRPRGVKGSAARKKISVSGAPG